MKRKIGSFIFLSVAIINLFSFVIVNANDKVYSNLQNAEEIVTTEIVEDIEEPKLINTLNSEINLTQDMPFDVVDKNSRGFSKPTKTHKWSEGKLSFAGHTSTGTTLYTDKYFSDFTNGTLTIKALDSYKGHPKKDVKVIIHRENIGFDTEIYSTTVKAGNSKKLNLSNYKSNKKYYIEFYGVFSVNGSLVKK
ncbi:MAG: hypothetical protein ACK5LT_04295 [Lachnospirales bacterium]